MRSGTGGVGVNPALDAAVRRRIAICAAMVRRAAVLAATLAEHRGAAEVTHADTCDALKHQARTFLAPGTPEEDAALDREVDEAEVRVRAFLDGDDSESECDSDDDPVTVAPYAAGGSESDRDTESDDDDVPRDDPPANKRPRRAACECPSCAAVRASVDGWDGWEPGDPAEAELRRAVDRAMAKVGGA